MTGVQTCALPIWIGDATLAATDYNGFFQTWSLIKPSTEMEVLVTNVAVGQAEERGLLVARKMLSLLQSEPKPAQ